MSKKRSKKSKEFKDRMREKTTGEFLNDQLAENGMTNKGDMTSMYNSTSTPQEKQNKNMNQKQNYKK